MLLFAIVIGLVLLVLNLAVCMDKVRDYVASRYGNAKELSVHWTLLGPWAPGDNKAKFHVKFIDIEGNPREFYALTNLFGSVYIRE